VCMSLFDAFLNHGVLDTLRAFVLGQYSSLPHSCSNDGLSLQVPHTTMKIKIFFHAYLKQLPDSSPDTCVGEYTTHPRQTIAGSASQTPVIGGVLHVAHTAVVRQAPSFPSITFTSPPKHSPKLSAASIVCAYASPICKT
jgi:hypothetical protein